MRAMILAAGLGSRLRPLTEYRAKPAVPIVQQAVSAYILPRLKACGIEDIAVNTHHLPETIREALGHAARELALNIHFVHEPELLGTGGGIRNLADFFGSESALILNGDFLFDVDLKAVIETHRRAVQNGALATMVLREDPRAADYGQIGVDETGRVQDLVGWAKQAPQRVIRQGMFSGVHILEPALRAKIPATGAPCILRTAYLTAFKAGGHIHSHFEDGIWRDIGTPEGYLKANFEVLDGRIQLFGVDLQSDGQVYIPPGHEKRVGGAQIIGPVSLAAGCELGADAKIGPYVVLGAGARVGEKAQLSQSVLWPGSRVKAETRLQGAVVYGADRSWMGPMSPSEESFH